MTRKLVIFNDASNDFEAVDPQDASVVAIPTFRMVTATPATGTTIGEAIVNTVSNQAFVWNGNRWTEVTPSAITKFPTDADLLAGPPTDPNGTYAMAADTGHLYMGTAGGRWAIVGTITYPTQAGLLADVPSDGAIGYALDTGAVFYRLAGTWKPGSMLSGTFTTLLNMTSTPGQIAVPTDRPGLMTADGAGGWNQLPWAVYNTEVQMTADTPGDGTLAVATDTGHVGFYTAANGWTWINSSAVPAAQLAMVGDIKQSLLTVGQFIALLPVPERNKWRLADGQDITGTALAGLIGQNTIWDLRGAYLRMGGQNAGNAGWNGGTLHTWQEDATKMPINPFTATAAPDGVHSHSIDTYYNNVVNGNLINSFSGVSASIQRTNHTRNNSPHSHAITMAGGDGETRPKSFVVNYFVKVD